MKIIAFGASYSRNSINKQFAAYAAAQFEQHEVEVLDLNDYVLPLFTVDLETEIGHPQAAHDFLARLESADLIIISMAEHNGSYTAAFKNLFDWTSRIKLKMFEGKKVFLLATAPGQGGGLRVLESAENRFPRHGAELVGTFSLPKFGEHFDPMSGIRDHALKSEFTQRIQNINEQLCQTSI